MIVMLPLWGLVGVFTVRLGTMSSTVNGPVEAAAPVPSAALGMIRNSTLLFKTFARSVPGVPLAQTNVWGTPEGLVARSVVPLSPLPSTAVSQSFAVGTILGDNAGWIGIGIGQRVIDRDIALCVPVGVVTAATGPVAAAEPVKIYTPKRSATACCSCKSDVMFVVRLIVYVPGPRTACAIPIVLARPSPVPETSASVDKPVTPLKLMDCWLLPPPIATTTRFRQRERNGSSKSSRVAQIAGVGST